MLTQIVNDNVCLSCGACCSYFRVSFYWAEGEQIPAHLQEQLSPVYACMKGTNQQQPRCHALEGEVGTSVSCSIYALRSSSCKEVQVGDEKCQKARLAHGFISVIQVDEEFPENDPDFEHVS